MNAFKRFAEKTDRVSRGVARIELFICQALIVGFAVLLLVNVTLRYTVSRPIYFAEELAVYILIWMAFLAIAATIARREMIALTFLADATPPALHRLLDVLVEVLILTMMVMLAWVSWRWLSGPTMAFERALTLGTLKWPFYAIVPIFFVLASFHTAANLLVRIASVFDPSAGPPARAGSAS